MLRQKISKDDLDDSMNWGEKEDIINYQRLQDLHKKY